MHRLFACTLLASTLGACAASGTESDDTESASAAVSKGSTQEIVIQSKAYLASFEGRIGTSVGRRIYDNDYGVKWWGDELVKDGAIDLPPENGDMKSGGYKLWTEARLSVTCNDGSATVTASAKSEAGDGSNGRSLFAGGSAAPVHVALSAPGEGVPGKVKFAYLSAHTTRYEMSYTVAMSRDKNRQHFWYLITGEVSCDASGRASVEVTDEGVTSSKVPSLRVWTSRVDPSAKTRPKEPRLVVDRAQAELVEFFFLDPLPPLPAP